MSKKVCPSSWHLTEMKRFEWQQLTLIRSHHGLFLLAFKVTLPRQTADKKTNKSAFPSPGMLVARESKTSFQLREVLTGTSSPPEQKSS